MTGPAAIDGAPVPQADQLTEEWLGAKAERIMAVAGVRRTGKARQVHDAIVSALVGALTDMAEYRAGVDQLCLDRVGELTPLEQVDLVRWIRRHGNAAVVLADAVEHAEGWRVAAAVAEARATQAEADRAAMADRLACAAGA